MSVRSVEKRREHAVVIGCGIAGLLAARVLSDAFHAVTVVERDVLLDDVSPRGGTPQARHPHIILGKGYEIITRFFPGLEEELLSGGAVMIDPGCDLLWHHYARLKPPHPSGLRTLSLTRPYLEWTIRRRVQEIANVTIRSGRVVKGLHLRHGSVRGVRLADGDGRPSILRADLVVDAAGRGSTLPRMLRDAGRPAPKRTVVSPRVTYASRFVSREPDDPARIYVEHPASLAGTRGGVAIPVERDRWHVILFGWAGDAAGNDPRSFAEFAASLPGGVIAQILARGEPRGRIQSFKHRTSIWNRYAPGRSGLPPGLVVIGDTVCSFNPIYAQGITVAAVEAGVLRDALDSHRDNGRACLAYHRRVRRIVRKSWIMAASEDLRFPADRQKPRIAQRALVHMAKSLHRAAGADILIYERLTRVLHLAAPMTSLLRPRIIRKVMSYLVRDLTRDPGTPSAHRGPSAAVLGQHNKDHVAAIDSGGNNVDQKIQISSDRPHSHR